MFWAECLGGDQADGACHPDQSLGEHDKETRRALHNFFCGAIRNDVSQGGLPFDIIYGTPQRVVSLGRARLVFLLPRSISAMHHLPSKGAQQNCEGSEEQAQHHLRSGFKSRPNPR